MGVELQGGQVGLCCNLFVFIDLYVSMYCVCRFHRGPLWK